jgi:RNA polymerase sigma factor (sigma-70 family)
MQNETMNGEKPTQFRITVKARMYHGVLHETMTRLGMNRAKMAEYLGISLSSLGDIMRLKRVPRFKTESEKRLKHKLEELTEITVSELFPKHIFTEEFLGQDKTIQVTKDIPIHLLENAGMVRQITLPPDEELMQREKENGLSHENLKEALSTLTKRQRKILYERFFHNKSLKQIGKDLGISGGFVEQIEKKSLRRLRHPMRIGLIRGEIRLEDQLFQTWLKEFNERPMAHLEK